MTRRIEVGCFILTNDDGMARLEIVNDSTNVWVWPTNRAPETWQSMGEELAKALALIDGRFEVRRFK